MAQPRSPREAFLALVNSIADGNPDGLPELYAEQTDVVHPFVTRSAGACSGVRPSAPCRAAGSATSRSTRQPTPR
jgi:hypothetical protein